MNNNVLVASGDEHLAFIHAEIPDIFLISFPGFKTSYSRHIPQYLFLLLRIPALIYHSIREHQKIKRIIKDFDIDVLISDNRFGLWNKKITTVYVTHMPLIPFPRSMRFLEPFGVFLHRLIIKKYTFCFIPDLQGNLNISGRLSHGLDLPSNVRFIGILSRFSDVVDSEDENLSAVPHCTVLLSGPQPQREMLRRKLISLLKDRELTTYFFEGKPADTKDESEKGKIIFYNHRSSFMMKKILASSEWIIARSGYSTIMDLLTIGCMAMLVPTPGQTEQEYLAWNLSNKGWFQTLKQDELLSTEIIQSHRKNSFDNEIVRLSCLQLDKVLNELSEYQHKQSKSKKSG